MNIHELIAKHPLPWHRQVMHIFDVNGEFFRHAGATSDASLIVQLANDRQVQQATIEQLLHEAWVAEWPGYSNPFWREILPSYEEALKASRTEDSEKTVPRKLLWRWAESEQKPAGVQPAEPQSMEQMIDELEFKTGLNDSCAKLKAVIAAERARWQTMLRQLQDAAKLEGLSDTMTAVTRCVAINEILQQAESGVQA
jgi:hypothetical protein